MAKPESAGIVEIKQPDPKPASRLKPLTPNQCKLLESVNNRWRAVVPKGTTREQLRTPDLWRVVSTSLTRFDKIAIVDEASTFFAEMLVYDCGMGYAMLVELSFTDLPRVVVTDDDVPVNHVIEHLGPESMWTIRRISDSAVMGKGFSSREEALAYLLDHATLRG